jgi:hypothetical protein
MAPVQVEARSKSGRPGRRGWIRAEDQKYYSPRQVAFAEQYGISYRQASRILRVSKSSALRELLVGEIKYYESKKRK